jgi:hypothetical protein
VTGGNPIAIFLQSISGVSAINPLLVFYDIHGGKILVKRGRLGAISGMPLLPLRGSMSGILKTTWAYHREELTLMARSEKIIMIDDVSQGPVFFSELENL